MKLLKTDALTPERYAAQAPALRERHHYSTFDVGRSMFDVPYFL
jgi:hypothetical protein